MCFWLGTYDVIFQGTTIGTGLSIPSTQGNGHYFPMGVQRVFTNLPIGSTFTFKYGTIAGASVSNTIEFSFANDTGASKSDYEFAMCKCNGDGEITINI